MSTSASARPPISRFPMYLNFILNRAASAFVRVPTNRFVGYSQVYPYGTSLLGSGNVIAWIDVIVWALNWWSRAVSSNGNRGYVISTTLTLPSFDTLTTTRTVLINWS